MSDDQEEREAQRVLSYKRKPQIQEFDWGTKTLFAATNGYQGERIFIARGKKTEAFESDGQDFTAYAHRGSVVIVIDRKEHGLESGKRIHIPTYSVFSFLGKQESAVLFLFSRYIRGNYIKSTELGQAGDTFDRFKRYWGEIETITNDAYCAKRIAFNPGQCHSLHYHVLKDETFYVEEGSGTVRARDRFANDQVIPLKAGDVFWVPPGLMHQIKGIEQLLVFEASTKTEDDDSDTYRAEKGQGFKMSQESHPVIKQQGVGK